MFELTAIGLIIIFVVVSIVFYKIGLYSTELEVIYPNFHLVLKGGAFHVTTGAESVFKIRLPFGPGKQIFQEQPKWVMGNNGSWVILEFSQFKDFPQGVVTIVCLVNISDTHKTPTQVFRYHIDPISINVVVDEKEKSFKIFIAGDQQPVKYLPL